MSSHKKIEANRRNAKKSTGPKTANGKALSKLNALRMGSHAKTRVLPFEDPKDYEDIAHEVYSEIVPKGFLEDTLTDQIIYDRVILRRLERAENAHLVSHARFVAQERVVQSEEFSRPDGLIAILDTPLKRRMHEARGTKIEINDMETALANSVGKNEGDLYERIDYRRRAVVRDIVVKYREIECLREKRLKVIEPM